MLHDDLLPELRRIRDELEKLNTMKIHVGVQGGVAWNEHGDQVDTPASILTIAGVHEYGMTIHAKHVKNLTIPISPKAKGRRAGEFDDLFVFTAESGERFLVREKGRDSLEFMYWLTPAVTIPERSFIRGSFDSGKDTMDEARQQAIGKIIRKNWTAKQAADFIGVYAVKVVKEYFRKGGLMPKSPVTLASDSRKTTPLIDTGRLRNSITYRIEGD